MRFIRKNGRIIPIADKGQYGTQMGPDGAKKDSPNGPSLPIKKFAPLSTSQKFGQAAGSAVAIGGIIKHGNAVVNERRHMSQAIGTAKQAMMAAFNHPHGKASGAYIALRDSARSSAKLALKARRSGKMGLGLAVGGTIATLAFGVRKKLPQE